MPKRRPYAAIRELPRDRRVSLLVIQLLTRRTAMSFHGNPRTIGPWRIVEEWARNRDYATYRADPVDGSSAALLHFESDAPLPDPCELEVFSVSCEEWIQFRHLNVAALRDFGTLGRESYLVVEFPGGRRLDRLPESERRNGRFLTWTMGQVADAMAHAPFPTRWLLPQSVVITPAGVPIVTDFAALHLFHRPTREAAVPPLSRDWATCAWARTFYIVLTGGMRMPRNSETTFFLRDEVEKDLTEAGVSRGVALVLIDILTEGDSGARCSLSDVAVLCRSAVSGDLRADQ